MKLSIQILGLLSASLALDVLAWVPLQTPNPVEKKSSVRHYAQQDSSSELAGASSRRDFLAAGVMATTIVSTNPRVVNAESTTAASDSQLQRGASAPAFELPSTQGTGKVGTTSLASLLATGKWTVLYFYPGAFTSGCTLEAKAFQRDLEEYRVLNAQIVGVSVDPLEKNSQFCSATGLDFYLLSDAGGKVSTLYGTSLSIPGFGSFSNRQTYLIDPKGRVQWVFTDVESRIPRHSREVLEKLTELTAKA